MRLQVIEGPHDGAVLILEPGEFYQEGLPDDLGRQVEAELRAPQVFQVFSAQEGTTDAGETFHQPPLETQLGIDAVGLATARRVIGAALIEVPGA